MGEHSELIHVLTKTTKDMNKLTNTQKKNLNLASCETYYDMDGFIYQQVLSLEVPDLMNMSKEVYELHEDNSESLVENGIVNESSTYGIEVGFLDDLESKVMFLGINKGLGLPSQSDEPEEAGLGDYKAEDFDAMLHTLDVAMDEFSQIYNHSASNDFREYYENHMTQLDNIITLINKLK
jgi:hypothetical protein